MWERGGEGGETEKGIIANSLNGKHCDMVTAIQSAPSYLLAPPPSPGKVGVCVCVDERGGGYHCQECF